MIYIGALLYFVLLAALFGGQARLTLRAIRTGRAGIGRLAVDRSNSPFGFAIWLLIYVWFLAVVALYLIGGLWGMLSGQAA